jgi:O-antigen ligase
MGRSLSNYQIQRNPLPNSGFILRRSSVSAYAVALGVSLALVGYTVLLMLVVNITGSTEASRVLTVPLRLIIVVMFGMAFVLTSRPARHPAVLLFLAFALLYIGRIGIEWTSDARNLYRPPLEFFLYFISFVAAPFFLLSYTRFTERTYDLILWCLFIATTTFGVVTVLYYGTLVGEVGRISHAVTRDDNYVSPLALSYVSALALALISVLWVNGGGSRLAKAYLAVLFVVLLIPFFLGASRGAVVALGFVAAFFLVFQGNVKHRVGLLLLVGVGVGIASYAQEYLGSGIFTRMAKLQSDIEAGASSAVRLVMWRDGLKQFWSAPIFGNSLQLETFRFHPHNLFVEIAISTGIFGLVAFSGFLIAIYRSAMEIVRKAPERSWVVVVFLMGFASNLFSGSVSAASMMAVGAGLIVATVLQSRNERAAFCCSESKTSM